VNCKTFIKESWWKGVVRRKNRVLLYILFSCLFIHVIVVFAKPVEIKNFPVNGTGEAWVLKVVFLSFVQGITEWFPVSSTGHLVIVQELLRVDVSVAFDVMLHLGTLIGVVLFLRGDLKSILKAVFKLDFSGREGRMLIYIILGTIPIALAGFLLKNVFESMFKGLLPTGVAMLLNGSILYSTRLAKPRKKMNALDAFIIGVSQTVSITPGISRIGITVSTALLRSVEKDEAYRFSLLLSIPTIIGGSLVKLQDVSFEHESSAIALGVLITAFIGYLALRTVRKYVFEQSFHKFAYYCVAVGTLILILSILKIL